MDTTIGELMAAKNAGAPVWQAASTSTLYSGRLATADTALKLEKQGFAWIETPEPVTYSIETKAYNASGTEDDNDKYVPAKSNVSIIDKIYACGEANKTYYVNGSIKNKNDLGNNLAVESNKRLDTDATGCGTVYINYTVNTSQLAGVDLVAYAKLTDGTETLATHENPDDNKQTLHVYSLSLGTTAVDNADNDKYIETGKAATIKDTVTFSGKPNTTYRFKGTIKVKGADNALQTATGTGQTEGDGRGTMTMNFTLTADQLPSSTSGKDLIVYEYMYENSDTNMNTPIQSHENDNDAAQTIHVYSLSLGTTATDDTDNDKYVEINKAATIKDVVTFSGKPRTTYRFKGAIKVKGADNALQTAIGTGQTEGDGKGTMTMSFALTAGQLPDTAAGEELIVYEYMYEESDTSMNTPIQSHENDNDVAQTINIISLSTTAVDNADNDKFIESAERVTIKDTVKYCLEAGKSYTIKGVLMDKATNEPLMINNRKVESTVEITPTTACGSAIMNFSFNATELAGKQLVVFETAYSANHKIIEHTNINDNNQTVNVISLSTVAIDESDNDHYIRPGEQVKIKDTVNYCLSPVNGQQAGQNIKYTIVSWLIDKATGEELTANGETRRETVIFTPTNSCGSLDVYFNIASTDLAGTEILVADALYLGDQIGGQLILTHNDLDDVDQSIAIIDLHTDATNNATGEKTLPLDSDVKIKDVVSYCLKTGQEYTLIGTLMDKKTGNAFLKDGKAVESKVTFTPEETCGEIEMYFDINTSEIGGAELVVFEDLYIGERLLIEHHDINDEDQTVIVELPAPETGLYVSEASGSSEQSPVIVMAVLSIIVIAGGYVGSRIISRRRFLR